MRLKRIISMLLAALMLVSLMVFVGAEETEETVESVTAMLESIDSLQQIQDKRDSYTVKTGLHWDISTTNESTKAKHQEKRVAYETYVDNMMAARLAAQLAYESLSPEEQAQIDSALVAKLYDKLSTSLLTETYAVTPRQDEYVFEAVKGPLGYGYEISNHMTGGEIPQTFVIVDTSDGKTEWTPNGLYEYGKSNYEVTYCCDYETGFVWGTDYKRINLEESPYFGEEAAKHIRAIAMNSYPFISIDEMKERLIEGGLSESFVKGLTRADLISAVQIAIWRYSNSDLITSDTAGYTGSINVTKNIGIYFTPYHDYSNEMWDWFPGAKTKTFNSETAYTINNLVYYLHNLEGVEAPESSIVVSDIKVGRQDIVELTEDLYSVGLHVMLSNGCQPDDDIKLNIVSYSEDAEGNVEKTASNTITVGSSKEYAVTIAAKAGDTIRVSVEGKQNLEKGVYMYLAEGGHKVSQSVVGVAEGETPVYAEKTFVLERDIEAGLRIYKKSSKDKAPISDITFHVYNVDLDEGEKIGETPTAADVEKYAKPENLVGSVVTDETGYAALELENHNIYLVIEEHNKEKVKKPTDPFFVILPWAVEKEVEGEDGKETVIEYLDVVSVYPKNTPNEPPIPPVPPPQHISGKFEIIKHDSTSVDLGLYGATFKVYRAANESDDESVVEMILVNGAKIAAVPVVINGAELELTTDGNGRVSSPDLECGIYYVKETKAPKGYIMRDDAVPVTVVANSVQEIVYVYVSNDRGIDLPETGGIGTRSFITVGSALVVLALGSMLAVRKRKACIK